MQPHSLHAWAWGSKSVAGTLAAMLAQEGLFDPDEHVATFLPELKHSGFSDATIRQTMDMTTAIKFEHVRGFPRSGEGARKLSSFPLHSTLIGREYNAIIPIPSQSDAPLAIRKIKSVV
jgi:CubicO group peptidase (beta-lactamase class C family)